MSRCDAHGCERPALYTGDDGRHYCSSACERRQLTIEAAAPDMLQALMGIIRCVDTDVLKARWPDGHEIAMARAAIAKAEGKAAP